MSKRMRSIEEILKSKVVDVTEEETYRLYDYLRRPQLLSSKTHCCISFEGFVEDGLIVNEENKYKPLEKRYRILTKEIRGHNSVGINFCPWCGLKAGERSLGDKVTTQ